MIGIYINLLNQFGDEIFCEIIGLKIVIGVMSDTPNRTRLMKIGFLSYKEWVAK